MPAWDLIPDTERTADSYTTFILFCEDKVNEPFYFRSFQNKKVKINVVEDQKSAFRNVQNMLAFCESQGLLESTGDLYQVKTGVTHHLWCVYDRDVEHLDPAQVNPQQNMAFNLSIQTATAAGLNVAWSNDVFELWILLHFEDVEPGIWQHRTNIYDRLTVALKALPNKSPEMTALTSLDNFRYEMFIKSRGRFLQFVLPLLAASRDEAIVRAAKLEAAFQPENRQHDRNPCTMVYHLVQSILSFM